MAMPPLAPPDREEDARTAAVLLGDVLDLLDVLVELAGMEADDVAFTVVEAQRVKVLLAFAAMFSCIVSRVYMLDEFR